ncbi:MAG: hypothetical protein Q9191_008366 [Dirinaria sp. TL-2023a]
MHPYLHLLLAILGTAAAHPSGLSPRQPIPAPIGLHATVPANLFARSNTDNPPDGQVSVVPVVHNSTIKNKPSNCAPPGYPPDTPSTCGQFNVTRKGVSGQSLTPDQLQIGYYVQPSVSTIYCLQDGTGGFINPASCISNIQNLCDMLSQQGSDAPPRGQWIWSSGGIACTFGAWLPTTQNTSAPNPSLDHCVNDILSPMAGTCGGVRGLNAASANLKVLPVENGTTGEAFDANYPSYIMVSETYDQICGGKGQPVCADEFIE